MRYIVEFLSLVEHDSIGSSEMPHRKVLSNEQRSRARRLRKDSTFPESILWSRLRGARLGGFKFRRQHVVETFVVDFYCHEASLVIELDGKSHLDLAQSDMERTAFLKRIGLRVVRVGNDDVLHDLDSILKMIMRECGGQKE